MVRLTLLVAALCACVCLVHATEKPKKTKYSLDDLALNLPSFPPIPEAAKPLFKNEPELNPVYKPLFRPTPPRARPPQEQVPIFPLGKDKMYPNMVPDPNPYVDTPNPERFDDNDNKVRPPAPGASFRSRRDVGVMYDDMAPGAYDGNAYYGTMPEYYPATLPPVFDSASGRYDYDDVPPPPFYNSFGEIGAHATYIARHGRVPPPYYQPNFHSVRHHHAQKYPHFRHQRAHPYVHAPHPMRAQHYDEDSSVPVPPPPGDARTDPLYRPISHQSSVSEVEGTSYQPAENRVPLAAEQANSPSAAAARLSALDQAEPVREPTWPRSVAPPAQYYLPPDLPIF